MPVLYTNTNTVEDKIKFLIPFRRTAVARLKKKREGGTVCHLVKTAAPFDCVTILIFLVHRMYVSLKEI